MRTLLLVAVWLSFSCVKAEGINSDKVFHVSVCYDLLASIQYNERLMADTAYFAELKADTAYVNAVKRVNAFVKASNLCNLYSSLLLSKDDAMSCVDAFATISKETLPDGVDGEWVDNILEVKSDIVFVLDKLLGYGYEHYWKQRVKPTLCKRIEDYGLDESLLDSINEEIKRLSGPEPLGDEYPKIYILDIDNAFALNDESFCCTSLLLDKEIAKRYRINFVQVYIHENLHRLHLSEKVFDALGQLKADSFYSANEKVAASYGEGANEAFVVAAETFVSRKLGLKTDEDVYTEFCEYVEGSLVLAPIVYIHLDKKHGNESFNDFIIGLFDSDVISIGSVKSQYGLAMDKIKNRL